MTEQSSMHFYVNWAKERLDEMDATLASLEGTAGELRADARAKAEPVLAEMRNRRDKFQQIIEKQKEANEATWVAVKATLESDWNAFEASVQRYVDAADEQIGARQAAFQAGVDAQIKAWQEVAGKLHSAAAEFAADRRGEVEAVVKRMKDDAAAAEAKVNKLSRAGTKSWSALSIRLWRRRAPPSIGPIRRRKTHSTAPAKSERNDR